MSHVAKDRVAGARRGGKREVSLLPAGPALPLPMSQRGYYGFEKRRKEGARRAKQEAKRQRKTDRAQEGIAGPEMGEPQEIGAQPGVWEWFSPSRNRTVTSAAGMRPGGDAPDDWILLTDVGEQPGAPS